MRWVCWEVSYELGVRTQFVDKFIPPPRLRVSFHATQELPRRHYRVGLRFGHPLPQPPLGRWACRGWYRRLLHATDEV